MVQLGSSQAVTTPCTVHSIPTPVRGMCCLLWDRGAPSTRGACAGRAQVGQACPSAGPAGSLSWGRGFIPCSHEGPDHPSSLFPLQAPSFLD